MSSDSSNLDAFRGWYAIVAYPKNPAIRVENLYREFDNSGKCLLSIQESDYIGLGRPGKIWLYSNLADLLAGNRADVEVSFSLSGSSAGQYQGNPLYKLTVRAKPPKVQVDPLTEATGYYQLWQTRSELFIPGVGASRPVEKEVDYQMYERESAEVWLEYNVASMHYKTKTDPMQKNFRHEKISDYYYVYEHTDEFGNYTKRTIQILALGSQIEVTYLYEGASGSRTYEIHRGVKIYPESKW